MPYLATVVKRLSCGNGCLWLCNASMQYASAAPSAIRHSRLWEIYFKLAFIYTSFFFYYTINTHFILFFSPGSYTAQGNKKKKKIIAIIIIILFLIFLFFNFLFFFNALGCKNPGLKKR